ncbi:mandelate racemase/muconate lactonizing enzyme family protein [Sodalis sp. RH21]|uniref:mandelate racemase/muconate lactonizing enzyme family protein n=1 Tax=unclassified Sodalis (in: enterobacteria) TaxID=2636512 RepID=UPI0039B458C6
MKATLYRAALRYPHLRLYTASSGSVAALDELYLLLEDRGIRGLGEVRINIAYLNGYAPQQVLDDVQGYLRLLDLGLDAGQLLAGLDIWAAGCLAPTRMLLDIALHDLLARQQNISVARLLAGDTRRERLHTGIAPPINSPTQGRQGSAVAPQQEDEATARLTYPTNQTLFWSSREQMLQQADAYVERGFTDLKLRVGVAGFDQDLDRVGALRRRFGDAIRLAADANGQWPAREALARLRALAPFDLRYVEQPIADGEADHGDHGYRALADASPIPLMLDESMSSDADLARIIGLGGKVWAHLKLVKMGGLGPILRAARRLNAAGIPFMIGQMNEGAAATAAALHAACATRPAHAELYGADGLGNDPVAGLIYSRGLVSSPSACGLGVNFDPARAEFIQEFCK